MIPGCADGLADPPMRRRYIQAPVGISPCIEATLHAGSDVRRMVQQMRSRLDQQLECDGTTREEQRTDYESVASIFAQLDEQRQWQRTTNRTPQTIRSRQIAESQPASQQWRRHLCPIAVVKHKPRVKRPPSRPSSIPTRSPRRHPMADRTPPLLR